MYLHVGFFLGHWHTFTHWWQSPPRELPNGSSGATQLFLTATTGPQPCFSVKNTVTYSWWYRLMLTILLMSREIILSTAQTVTTSPRLLGAVRLLPGLLSIQVNKRVKALWVFCFSPVSFHALIILKCLVRLLYTLLWLRKAQKQTGIKW